MFDEENRGQVVMKKLEPWYDEEMAWLYGQAASRRPGDVLMGIPLWGKEFVDRFFIWCLPSLGSPENLKALRGRCRLVIYRPPAARPWMFRLSNWLRRNEIELVFRDIPDWVMSEMVASPDATPDEKEEKYELQFCMIGCVQNLIAHMAGRDAMGLHMLMPDHVYAQNYFPNMWRLAKQHDAVVQAGLSVDLDAACKTLDTFRDESPRAGWLSVPDRAIGDIAADHLHAESLSLFMNHGSLKAGEERIPRGPRLIWQSEQALHIYSCFHNAVWLAPHLMANAPIAFTSTMDCLMPEFIPPSETTGEPRIYTPKPSDGLAFMEVSMPGKRIPGRFVDAARYCEWMWNRVSFTRDYWPYFKRPMVLETSPRHADLSGKPVLPAAEIQKQFDQIMGMLEASRVQLMDEFNTRKFGSRFAREQLLPAMAAE
jgi:hypothetical protein